MESLEVMIINLLPFTRIDPYKFSFFLPATIRLWNNLSDEAVQATSINLYSLARSCHYYYNNKC